MQEILIVIATAVILVQAIKGIILSLETQHWRIKHFTQTGGMPSSHAAFVLALTTSIFLIEGATTSFAISLAFGLIVVRDAMGVRRTVGEESVALSKLLKKHKIKENIHINAGHTPLQVIVGSVIGILIAIAIHYLLPLI